MANPIDDIATHLDGLLNTLLVDPDPALAQVIYDHRTARVLQAPSPAVCISYQGHHEREADMADTFDFTLGVGAVYEGLDDEQRVDQTLREIEWTVKDNFGERGQYQTQAGHWLAVDFWQRSELLPTPSKDKGARYMQIYMRFIL